MKEIKVNFVDYWDDHHLEKDIIYKILKKHFSDVERRDYKDALVVDEAEPLVDYILSCHGNQKEYLVDKYTDFKKYVEKKLVKPMTITKEAGVFVCRK